MEIVILLVPLGLLLAGLAVVAFLWGLRRGQFDSLDSRGWEVVFDDQSAGRTSRPASESHAGETHPSPLSVQPRTYSTATDAPDSLAAEAPGESRHGGRQ